MSSDRAFVFTLEVLSAFVGLMGLVALSMGLYRIAVLGDASLDLVYMGFGATIATVSGALFLVCRGWRKRLS